jgi:signal transduction histidine kinase
MVKVDFSELHKNVLNDALLRLKTLLNAESASLFLFDKDHQELVLDSVLNEDKSRFEGLRQRLGDGVAGSVACANQPVLVKDIKNDPRFARQKFHHYHTDSFICVPIAAADGLIGVINFSDKASGDTFSEADFEMACLVAGLASRVVENQIQLTRLSEEVDLLKKERAKTKEERVFLEKFASMGKLAGGIVHEINNPLDAVMRYTNLLVEKDLDKSVASEYLNEIKVGLTRILKITRSLLEFSQQLKDNAHQELANVNDVMEEALSLFRHTLFQGHIRIEKHYQEFLPKVVDRGLCRVFSNIIKNAFDAMADGGTLSIATRATDDELQVAFRDTGSGISPDAKGKLFTPFFTTKPIGQGVGLGLPICFEVVQRYGGTINVDSQPGKGACFTIHLPLGSACPSGLRRVF